MPDNPSSQQEYQFLDPETQEFRTVVVRQPKRRYWLHALLFLLTVFTTLCIGARLQYDFANNLAAFNETADYFPWRWIMQDWHRVLGGIPFSACLLGILTAHEFGHFILCVRRRVYASLPYFIPFPNIIGTLGAFIRIQSPIRDRKDLFDIGIAGPIAGFMVAVPVLFYSLLLSKPLENPDAGIPFGLPLIVTIAQKILTTLGSHAPVVRLSLDQIYIHPMAVAAWVGMFATAMNLLPGGQFDGGHISYAVNPRSHRAISFFTIVALIPLGMFFSMGWFLWALFLRMSLRHPPVLEAAPIDNKRKLLALFALAMLIVTFPHDPFPGTGLLERIADLVQAVQQWRH